MLLNVLGLISLFNGSLLVRVSNEYKKQSDKQKYTLQLDRAIVDKLTDIHIAG